MIKKNLLFIILLGQILLSYSQELRIQAKEKGSDWSYYDLKGEKITSSEYKKCYPFVEDYALVYDEKAKKVGFINRSGEIKFPEDPKVEMMKAGGFGAHFNNSFRSGLAPVFYKGQVGYLGTDGKLKIEANYKTFTQFNKGYAIVGNKEGNFVLDSTGKAKLIGTKLTDFNRFQEGMAPVRVQSGLWGVLDTKGELVIAAKFKKVGYFTNGLAWARNEQDLIGYINKKGEWVIEPKFTKVLPVDPTTGMAKIYLDSYGWINTKDQSAEILRVPETDLYRSFSEGLCAGRQAGKIGFFDQTGKWVIQPKFVAVRSFVNGYAAAREGDLWGVIDTKGNWVIEPKFVSIKDFN